MCPLAFVRCACRAAGTSLQVFHRRSRRYLASETMTCCAAPVFGLTAPLDESPSPWMHVAVSAQMGRQGNMSAPPCAFLPATSPGCLRAGTSRDDIVHPVCGVTRALRKGRMARRAPRMAAEASSEGTQSEALSLADEVRMLLDPTVSLSAKSVLVQDMAKRGPQRGKDALEGAFSAVGLDGIPAVAKQVTEDIFPDLARNGPRYVSEFGRRLPDALSSAAASVQSGSAPFPTPPPPSRELFSTVSQELRNVFNRTPEGLETPAFELVEDRDGYQVRRYGDMMVASTAMGSSFGEDATELESASALNTSFGELAKYLFGKNTTGSTLAMTTPVIVDRSGDYSGRMSFIMPSSFLNKEAVPEPVSPVSESVTIDERPGRLYAVREFTGFATAGEIRRQKAKLQDALIRDGVQVTAEGEYSVLIYNGPSTLAFRRRNDICIPIEDLNQPAIPAPDTDAYVEVGDTTD